jgi:aminoglycoside phosphotransferase (APT) family kinase protein
MHSRQLRGQDSNFPPHVNEQMADTMSAERAAVIIRRQFPDLRPPTVTYLGEGCDSTAFDVDDTWVFRFPKRDDVEEQLLIETRIMPVLAERSPIPLPAYHFHGRPSAMFPRHFSGYAKLRGVPAIVLDPADVPFDAWAPELARFLSWLHTVPADQAARWGVPAQNLASVIEEVRADALGDFENLNRVTTDAPLEEWYACVAAGPVTTAASESAPVLVHADLAAEHVLCDVTVQRITGIIDWSELALGDRAVDLAGMFHWGGPAFVDALLADYDGRPDTAIRERARYLAVCRGVSDVTFGLEMNRREYIAAGLRALRLCAGAGEAGCR